MRLITKAEADEIGEKITEQERRTSGEIVAVLAAQSGSYRLMPLFIAAFVALLVPLVMLYLPLLTSGRVVVWSADRIYLIQLVVFLVTAFILSWRPIRLIIVPRGLKRKWAHAHAMEQFIAQDLHLTEHRTGVLIFVSVAEHYAEVIADSGIYEKVDQSVWQELIDVLVKHIKEGAPHAGFIEAIERAGDLLAVHFPPDPSLDDELPNHLILIE